MQAAPTVTSHQIAALPPSVVTVSSTLINSGLPATARLSASAMPRSALSSGAQFRRMSTSRAPKPMAVAAIATRPTALRPVKRSTGRSRFVIWVTTSPYPSGDPAGAVRRSWAGAWSSGLRHPSPSPVRDRNASLRCAVLWVTRLAESDRRVRQHQVGSPGAGRYPPRAGLSRHLHAGAQAKLLQRVPHMRADRVRRQPQLPGDLLVTDAGGRERHHT